MNTLDNCPVKEATTILIDREFTEEKTKGLLIVKNGHKVIFESGSDLLESIRQPINTPKSWEYTPNLLQDATPKTEVVFIDMATDPGALETAMINSIIFNNAEKGLSVNKKHFEPFIIKPKIIIEVDQLTEMAEEILCKTFDIHRL